MTVSRFTRVQKAGALVPIALLSTAWTLNTAGVLPTSVASHTPSAGLPGGTELPAEVVEDPASVTEQQASDDDLAGGSEMVRTASTSGIPAAALAAYQRAATVINTADRACNLDWQLVAAIGRVESNHGRANGNVLTSQGVATPGIYGVPLDGDGVARIVDTDGGQYDGDTGFDRAVGPMQFIPATWSVVGVDADSDGRRDPQDIDDAALGSAVYLCSGEADLATDPGRRQAVNRYNHSDSYVETVLGVYDAYLDGEYTSVPNNTVGNDTVITAAPAPAPRLGTKARPDDRSAAVPAGSSSTPGDDATTTAPAPQPDAGAPDHQAPVEQQPQTKPRPGVGGAVQDTAESAGETLTKTGENTGRVLASIPKLTQMCTSSLATKLPQGQLTAAVQDCVDALEGTTVTEANNLIGGIVGGLVRTICSLPGIRLICQEIQKTQ